VKAFLEQSARDHVYWVERSGKAQKNLALNAAPVDVADFLRRRLFESGTSIIMTSATLATSNVMRGAWRVTNSGAAESKTDHAPRTTHKASPANAGLDYFTRRVGAESATMLQVGTPFDYERQMKIFAVRKMPDPRESATPRRWSTGSGIS